MIWQSIVTALVVALAAAYVIWKLALQKPTDERGPDVPLRRLKKSARKKSCH